MKSIKSIIDKVEEKYRKDKNFGVQFSIDPDAYNCDIADDRIYFGDNTTKMDGSSFTNCQPILIDGKEVGLLHEWQHGGLFDPICTSFEIVIADCQDDDFDEKNAKYAKNPHFCDGDEWSYLCFATLQQFVDYLRQKGEIK